MSLSRWLELPQWAFISILSLKSFSSPAIQMRLLFFYRPNELISVSVSGSYFCCALLISVRVSSSISISLGTMDWYSAFMLPHVAFIDRCPRDHLLSRSPKTYFTPCRGPMMKPNCVMWIARLWILAKIFLDTSGRSAVGAKTCKKFRCSVWTETGFGPHNS